MGGKRFISPFPVRPPCSNQDAGELQREWLRVYQGSLRTVAPLSPLIAATSAATAYLNFRAGLPLVAAAFGVAALAQVRGWAFTHTCLTCSQAHCKLKVTCACSPFGWQLMGGVLSIAKCRAGVT